MKQSIRNRVSFLIAVFAILIICYFAGFFMGHALKSMNKIKYPNTEKCEVSDDYFGTTVSDPYRWLEDDNSVQTLEWAKKQNRVTREYLDKISCRKDISERLMQLYSYTAQSIPQKHGEWYYMNRRTQGENQYVLCRARDFRSSEWEVFLDPNTLSEDGTVALNFLSFTRDGKYLAYGLCASGSDWVEFHVMDTETKRVLDDTIRWIKFSGVSWSADNRGFYYSAYDRDEDDSFSSRDRDNKVYFHLLGQNQSEDIMIYAEPQRPFNSVGGWESEDGKWIFVSSEGGTSGNELLFRSSSERNFRVLLPGFENDYRIIDTKQDTAYVFTNDGAQNYHLIAINLLSGKRSVILAEKQSALSGVTTAGGFLYASYFEDVCNHIEQYDYQGNLIRCIELPLEGSVEGFSGGPDDRYTFYSATNYSTPSTIYSLQISDGTSQKLFEPEVGFDSEAFITEKVFCTSKDGTRIPLFISHRKDIELNGENPCYLYGYGGFQISIKPSFSSVAILMMEQGGIYCVANIRGGLEYGEQWHRMAMVENKQNCFDDFISAAEFLIEKGYTSSRKLAIAGRSNGGLLVGACMTQRPDLYAVCLPGVGVLDMLRYHKFTCGYGWVVEYGCSDNEQQFRTLLEYSPLHNIREGVNYPATLIITADHDDRVVPAHSFKFAATLQECQNSDKPVLIRIEHNAGHGAGMPLDKRVAETSDCLAFLFKNTDTKFKKYKQ